MFTVILHKGGTAEDYETDRKMNEEIRVLKEQLKGVLK